MSAHVRRLLEALRFYTQHGGRVVEQFVDGGFLTPCHTFIHVPHTMSHMFTHVYTLVTLIDDPRRTVISDVL